LLLTILPFLNFVIRLSDNSGINEKMLSLTNAEKYKNTQGIRLYGYFVYACASPSIYMYL